MTGAAMPPVAKKLAAVGEAMFPHRLMQGPICRSCGTLIA